MDYQEFLFYRDKIRKERDSLFTGRIVNSPVYERLSFNNDKTINDIEKNFVDAANQLDCSLNQPFSHNVRDEVYEEYLVKLNKELSSLKEYMALMKWNMEVQK